MNKEDREKKVAELVQEWQERVAIYTYCRPEGHQGAHRVGDSLRDGLARLRQGLPCPAGTHERHLGQIGIQSV